MHYWSAYYQLKKRTKLHHLNGLSIRYFSNLDILKINGQYEENEMNIDIWSKMVFSKSHTRLRWRWKYRN